MVESGSVAVSPPDEMGEGDIGFPDHPELQKLNGKQSEDHCENVKTPFRRQVGSFFKPYNICTLRCGRAVPRPLCVISLMAINRYRNAIQGYMFSNSCY